MEPLRDPNGEFVFVFQCAIDEKVFPFRIVLNGCDTVFCKVSENQLDSATSIGGARLGSVLLDEADGGTFEQHAGEFAVGIVLEFTALRVGCFLLYAGLFESKRVRNC